MKKLNYIKHEVKNWLLERKLTGKDLPKEEKRLFQLLKTQGYVVIRNYWSESQCAQCRALMDKTFEDYVEKCWQDGKGSDVRVYGAERILEPARMFWEDAKLKRLAAAYAGLEQVKGFVMINRTKFKKDNLGSGGGWHRDSAANRQFKAILYLSDAKEENGPFEYFPKSHAALSLLKFERKAGVKMHQNRLSEEEVVKLETSPKTLTGRTGDLILVDTRGVHRGRPLQRGSRYAMTNYYLPFINDHFKSLLVEDNG